MENGRREILKKRLKDNIKRRERDTLPVQQGQLTTAQGDMELLYSHLMRPDDLARLLEHQKMI